MKIIRILSIILITAFFINFALIKPTRAEVAVSVSPTQLDFNINPGESKTEKLILINSATKPQLVKLEFFDAEIVDDKLVSTGKNTPNSSYQLINSINQITINSNESKEFEIKLVTPSKANPGGYYKTLKVTAYPNDEVEKVDLKPGEIGATQKVNSVFEIPILIGIKGKVIDTGELVKFETEQSEYKTGPVKFNVTFKNTGNIHYKPKGTIIIYNSNNKKMDEITVEQSNVLAKSERTLTATWDKKYIAYGGYTAKLILFYGVDSNRSAYSNANFKITSNGLLAGNNIIYGGVTLLVLLMFMSMGKKKGRRR